MVKVIQVESGVVRQMEFEQFNKSTILSLVNDDSDNVFEDKHIHVVEQPGIVACSVLHDNGLALVTFIGDTASWQVGQLTE